MSSEVSISTRPGLYFPSSNEFKKKTLERESSIPEERFWNAYFSHASPTLKGNFPYEDVQFKESIRKIIDKMIKSLKNEFSLGEIIYQRGVSAYIAHLRHGRVVEKELSNWEVYDLYLKPTLFSVLKKDVKLKQLQHYETSFFPFDREPVPFQIFKMDDVPTNQYPIEQAPCDFVLKGKDGDVSINSQALIQHGGSVVSALVYFAVFNNEPYESLSLEHYSMQTLESYKILVSSGEKAFSDHVKRNRVESLCDLYTLAQESACETLKTYCVKLLEKKITFDDLGLLTDLMAKYKDEDLQRISDKFRSEDLFFDLDPF